MRLDQFDFDLPPELIAQHPPQQRGQSRLLYLNGCDGALRDLVFEDMAALLAPGDLLVLNDTRVINARLVGEKSTGGRVDLLIERVLDSNRALALLHASHAPRPGAVLNIAGGAPVRVLERRGEFYLLEFEGQETVLELLERVGSVPLPPYIRRRAYLEDATRYQTVYANAPGAVAAPTAGLHFDRALLDTLRERGVDLAFLTLHVGAGTFQPVRVSDLEEHRMHSELYQLPEATAHAITRARSRGAHIVAVGTTTLRALESAASAGTLRAGNGETSIFIRPGFRFRVVDRLITNFHLPRSTLLMLVCAFAGMQNTLRAYRHAIAERYSFFSYGDAMLIDPSPEARCRSDAMRT
jgi:S-adenosylmethionine:tRNA ribosyltransferase-isomerase